MNMEAKRDSLAERNQENHQMFSNSLPQYGVSE